ncbi:GNAT family N-acetyltransferase [Sciscionella sediminilitoris]|uniref:GNAT family N-acetyltransferase n=1 Tax=Sciscionella sediminilitoris TaxID=1445613 RepID=UPI0004DFC72F|nr:GNAT family N-acetyltransferase [Sciscionella sp. SE31]
MDTAAVLAEFDARLRLDPALEQPGDRVERTAHTVRYLPAQAPPAVLYYDGGGDPGKVIAGEARWLAEHGGEWKYYSHDRPVDLPERLRAAGLRAEEPEAFMLAETELLAPYTPAGVEIRAVTEETGYERLLSVQRGAFGHTRHAAMRERLLAGVRAGNLALVLALVDGEPACGGRIEFHAGTGFASLWGGGTLPGFRGRGAYRALVAHRAALAAARGYRYLYSDCSPDSEPILARTGFTRLATTIPFTI